MSELFLLRHGATEWNRAGRYAGHTDLPLDRAELHRLTGAKERLKGIVFNKVYCSDLQRARETLEEVRPDLNETAILDARLRELDFGQWEGKTYEELKSDRLYNEWLADPRQAAPPGGETMIELESRIRSFIQERLKREAVNSSGGERYEPVLIVAHGGPIRLLITQLRPGISFWDIDLPCGGLYRIGEDRNGLIRLDD